MRKVLVNGAKCCRQAMENSNKKTGIYQLGTSDFKEKRKS